MHIYSIEVEDSQTCHDFWKKNKCIVVNMSYGWIVSSIMIELP